MQIMQIEEQCKLVLLDLHNSLDQILHNLLDPNMV